MFNFHMFFHDNNVICFVICNQTFLTSRFYNFKTTHVIVTNYACHHLVEIEIYGLVIIYLKNAHVNELIVKLHSRALFFNSSNGTFN
jgi:hypothetical protein